MIAGHADPSASSRCSFENPLSAEFTPQPISQPRMDAAHDVALDEEEQKPASPDPFDEVDDMTARQDSGLYA